MKTDSFMSALTKYIDKKIGDRYTNVAYGRSLFRDGDYDILIGSTDDAMVMEFKDEDLIKLAIGFVTDMTDTFAEPGIVFGSGNAYGDNRGFITKDTNSLNMYYIGDLSESEVAGFAIFKDKIESTVPITVNKGLAGEFILDATNWAAKLTEADAKAILENPAKAWDIPKANLDATYTSVWDTAATNAATMYTLLYTTKLNESYIQDAALTASKLNVDQIMLSGCTWTDNDPSAGYIKWAGAAITVNLNGVSKTITAGNTNKKYVYWTVGNTTFTASDTRPTESNTVWMIAINNSGTHAKAYYSKLAQKYIGAAYIDDLAVEDAHIKTMTASKITAGTISAAVVLGSTLATAAVGNERIVIDSTDGFVKRDNNGYKRLQIDTSSGGGTINFLRDSLGVEDEIRGQIFEAGGVFVIRPQNSFIMTLGTAAHTTELYGTMDFTNATVSGLSAVWG